MTATTVTVRYRSAQPADRGPLTLGQDNMIRCIRHDEPSHMNKQAVWPVPETADAARCLDALRTLAERHPALRTVFPGPADRQPTVQQVGESGEFTVRVEEIGPAADPDAAAMEAGRIGRGTAFDLAREFPLRCTLLTAGGRPVRLAVVICHAQLDGAATGLLYQEWLTLVTGGELPPPGGLSPIEVAGLEQSASGRRRAAASLRHWERILREEPAAVFTDDRIGPSDTLLPTLTVRSVAGARALERAVRRHAVGPSAILLACYAALAAHRAAQPTVVVAALSANRHRSALADHIGTLAQDALLALDTDCADLDQLIGRAQASALAGYWHSTFDAERIWDLIEEVAVDRGTRFARHVVVNDLSGTVPEEIAARRPDPPADPDFDWLPPEPIPTRLMLNIWRISGCLEITLHTHPDVLDRAETETFARALLRLLELVGERTVALAELAGPAVFGGRAELPAGRREKGTWRQIDNSWIDLDAVGDLLRDALGGADAELTEQDGRLTARIGPGAVPDTPEAAHAAVMAALPGRDTAMAPHWYVLPTGEGSGRRNGADG